MKNLYDWLVHRLLRVPYTLHLRYFRSPKKYRATIVLLHGIGNSADAWEELIPLLPPDIRVIGVDLLGFGNSPKPTWVRYSAAEHARSVGVSLLRAGVIEPVVLVGHSLGALVSVEIARRYPFAASQLVLCSPPFYSVDEARASTYEKILRQLYQAARRRPDRLVALSPLAVKAGIANKVFRVDQSTVGAYVGALGASILNQDSLKHVSALRVPVRILYGTFDPVIITGHIKRLEEDNDFVTSRELLVGHEITGGYTKTLAKEITRLIAR